MSGKLDERVGMMFLTGNAEIDSQIIEIYGRDFDTSVMLDDQMFRKRQQKEKQAQKICAVRSLIFPVEWLAVFFIMGPSESKKRFYLQKEMIQYLRKKTSLEQLLEAIVRYS